MFAIVLVTAMIFLSNENLEQIVTIFGEYMRDKYSIDVTSNPVDNVPDLALKVMRMTAANAKGVESVKDLNVQVLGQLRRYYMNKLNSSPAPPPPMPARQRSAQPEVLIRDDAVFGNRKVVFSDEIPVDASINKKSVDLNKKMEALEARRNAEFSAPRPPEPEQGTIEKAESTEDFLAKVRQLELERETAPAPQAQVSSPMPASAFMGNASAPMQMPAMPMSAPLPAINVNRNLRVARNSLAQLNEGLYYIKCLSVKYKTDEFDHILSLRLSMGPEAPVVFKFVDYSLVGDKATVMYEPIFPNEKIQVDSGVTFDPEWLGFTLVALVVMR